ncbi:MAG: LPS-assembly protein LptD [Treponema sp.]|jgi:lipopolysaccharide assembly outer membrane protein LptD (OstA)|nr:LPS-assembly protein LptD [Treponema sp.]
MFPRPPHVFQALLLAASLFFGTAALPAQEQDEAPAPAPAPVELTDEERVLDQDIRTSTLAELAAWCRELSLSEGGTREDLAQRLRGFYGLRGPSSTNPDEAAAGKTITIEAARTTEYFTLEVVNEEYARLRGGVIVSLKDGDSTHRINAGEILYNRTRNIMSATGGVEYVREKGDTIETFKGESITVNLDNWSSVFMDGFTEKTMSAGDAAYSFSGTVISRSGEDVTIMNDAVISNAKNPEAYWSLNVSKLWLLPGSDWAVFNAVLKVGEIPVLWIPAFYYPSDEVIFHPVLGNRSREGNFAQTTTYIWGRPKASSTSESSITKIMGNGENMEKTREGLFLRSTGRKETDPNTKRLSFLFDVYSNLGLYLGTELTLPAFGIFGGLQFSGGLGFTRNVYEVSYGHSPFAQYDGSTEWNKGYFFSHKTPFRYRLNTSGSLAPGKYGTFSWVFPAYSDAYVDNDFMKRTEAMDWVKMLKKEDEEETTTTTTITTLPEYSWRINASLTPIITVLNPFVTSLALSSISSSVLFKPRDSTAIARTSVSPERRFFFPDKFTFFSISGTLGGTPLTLGGPQLAGKPDEVTEDVRLASIRPPWETPAQNDDTKKTDGGVDLKLPTLAQSFTLPKRGGPLFTFTYLFTPSTALEQQFRSSAANWPESEDIDWSEVTSIHWRSEITGNFSFNITQPETTLYAHTLRFSGNGIWDTYTFMNDEAEEYTTSDGVKDQTKIDNALLNVYKASLFKTYYEWNTTMKPFYANDIWSATNFQYSLKGLLSQTVFDGTAAEPSWETKKGEWTKEDIDTHKVTANFAASVMDHVQSLTVGGVLPPKDALLSTNATMRIWLTETNVHEDILEPFDTEKRTLNPIYFTETIKLGTNAPTFQQQFTYDPEIKEYTSVTSNLTWGGFTSSFAALRTKGYYFDAGWQLSSDTEKLNPSTLKFAYTKSVTKKELFNKNLSFTLGFNTSMTFDLQRYTYSRFDFGLNATIVISRFFDFTMSSTSENREMYRYFHGMDLPFFHLPIDTPEAKENNFFLDLVNSFRFDDDDRRRRSGFKLKTFAFKLVHHLGDWDATLAITLSPYQDTVTRMYKFNNEVSFLIQWIPITEIKSEFYYNKEVLTKK